MNLFLRAFGLFIAAGWFGATVFGLLGLAPATTSDAMQRLLGSNFPYFSLATRHVLVEKMLVFQFACAALLILHMLMEWLYVGRVERRLRLLLLSGALCLTLTSFFLVQPRIQAAHLASHAVNASAEVRQAAKSSFRTWQTLSNLLNWGLAVGLAVQLWRIANPPEPTRFVSAVKFRG